MHKGIDKIDKAIYLYDGSLEGLLSVLRELILNRTMPLKIISEQNYEPALFDEICKVYTASDNDIAEFINYIINRLSKDVINTVFLCCLSEIKDFQMCIYDYLTECLKNGKKEISNLTNPKIYKAYSICSKVKKECHRFYGLLRFQLLEDGIYYAPFEPDHNIISMIAPHFANRLRNQDWIIHDRKRDLAIFYNGQIRQMQEVDVDTSKIVNTSQEEGIQHLWQSYFKHLTINTRTNPRLQRQFMPKRYWKYLVEKN